MSMKVCVIGAGTVGLSQALFIQENFQDQVSVTVCAELFYSDTTSYGAAGLWLPSYLSGTPTEKIDAWGQVAFDHFLQLLYRPDAARTGVQLMTAYQLKQQDQVSTLPSWRNTVLNFKLLDATDMKKMGLPARFTHGTTFGTVVVDQSLYMTWLRTELEKLDVKFEQKKVENLQQFVKESCFDIVINCTGLGAGALIGKENEVVPIRGQVLRVKAPFMNNVFLFGSSYIIPNVKSVVLGGTGQKGIWDTTPSETDSTKILKDICEVFPAFQDVEIEGVWAGLRPYRDPLRLESELLEGKLIVHNYGHGGSGITLAMGCAEDVVKNHIIPYLQTHKN